LFLLAELFENRTKVSCLLQTARTMLDEDLLVVALLVSGGEPDSHRT
jgi:hypothetical protein